VRTSFHHQSEAQPPNGTLTAATSPDNPSHMPSHAVWSLEANPAHMADNCGAGTGTQAMGLAEVPTIYIPGLSEAQKRRARRGCWHYCADRAAPP
jgi:hypothetical protein